MQHQDWATVGWNRPTKTIGSGGPGAAAPARHRPTKATELDRLTEAQPVKVVPAATAALIRQARNLKGLTQAQLAQRINVAPRVVQQYEAGTAVPDAGVLRRISTTLGVSLKR